MLLPDRWILLKVKTKTLEKCIDVFRTISNIYDGAYIAIYQLKTNNYFRKKKLHRRCLTESYVRLWNAPRHSVKHSVSPCRANVSFLYPLTTSENQRFSDVFRGYRKWSLAWNMLMYDFMYNFEQIFAYWIFICLLIGSISRQKNCNSSVIIWSVIFIEMYRFQKFMRNCLM